MTGILMVSVGNSYGSLPVNTVAPSVSGTATVGSTLSTTNGTWTGAPAPTFTYQWQRAGSNIGGATASTYVLQFADAGNTVRCVVTATNPLGAVGANSNSTASVSLPAVGAAFGGGFFAGQISTTANGVATHSLIVGPKSTAQSRLQYATAFGAVSNTDSVIDGPTNSANMNSAAYPAAKFCNDLVIGGFSDWYSPAKNELEICWYNLKPNTNSNNTSSGTNTNAVPSRGSNYTAGIPAQTSAVAFQTPNAEAFNSGVNYWSSTQVSYNSAWRQSFLNGDQQSSFYQGKTSLEYIRAIRRIAV